MKDPRNFSNAKVSSVIRTSRESEGLTNMIVKTTQAFGSLPLRKEEGEKMKFISGKVPMHQYSTQDRALKLTFPWDIGGLVRDDSTSRDMGFGLISQTIGILTPYMYSQETQLLQLSWI